MLDRRPPSDLMPRTGNKVVRRLRSRAHNSRTLRLFLADARAKTSMKRGPREEYSNRPDSGRASTACARINWAEQAHFVADLASVRCPHIERRLPNRVTGRLAGSKGRRWLSVGDRPARHCHLPKKRCDAPAGPRSTS